MIDTCEHGHLRRVCEMCELKDEVQQLREALKVLAAECKKAKFAFASHVDVCTLAMNVNWAHVLAYNMACEATDSNPIAAAAVREAGR